MTVVVVRKFDTEFSRRTFSRRLIALAGSFVVFAGLLVLDAAAIANPRPLSKVPILFIHGAGLSSAMWTELTAALVAAGYDREDLRALDLRPNDGSNLRAAQIAIAPAIVDLLANAQRRAQQRGFEMPQRVDIVAHSMGAISSRWYIAFLQPASVRTWIGITPANHGTDAICGHAGEGAREICPAFAQSTRQSSVLVQLNGTPQRPRDESPYGLGVDRAAKQQRIAPNGSACIAYFTVRIEPDEWIKPERSAILDGAGGLGSIPYDRTTLQETSPGNFLFKAKTTHDDLARHPQLSAFVKSVLAAADDGYASACARSLPAKDAQRTLKGAAALNQP